MSAEVQLFTSVWNAFAGAPQAVQLAIAMAAVSLAGYGLTKWRELLICSGTAALYAVPMYLLH